RGVHRLSPVVVFYLRHDRRRVVDVVVDAGRLEAGRHDQRGDPGARAELVVRAGATEPVRAHVVPRAAELVVRHDHQGALAVRTLADGLEQADQVVAAV